MTKPLSVLFIVFLFPVASSFGQSKRQPPFVSVAATLAPVGVHTTYNRLYLYPDSDGQVVEPVFLNGNRWSPGYTAGLTVQYHYAPGWSVESGLWYQHLTTRQARPATAGEGQTTLRSRTVRIPLLLNYRLTTKRLSPYFSLGTLVDFPIPSRVIVTSPDQPRQNLRLRTDRGPVFHLTLGAGVQYQIDRRCALLVQPMYAYNLGRFGGSRTYNPAYELSLRTQVAYSF